MLYPVGCYGKLPLSAEFIRHNLGGVEFALLEAWIDDGLALARSRLSHDWATHFAASAPSNFLFFPGGDARRCWVGALMPSRDSVGRLFPFLLFRPVALSRARDVWLTPIRFATFLGVAPGYVHRPQANDVGGYRASLDRLALEPLSHHVAEEGYQTFLGKQTMEEFWGSVLGGFHDPQKYVIGEGIGYCVQTLTQQAQLPWTVKLPLMAGVGEEQHDLPFWLAWMTARLGEHLPRTLLVWKRAREGPRPCLDVCFGKLFSHVMIFHLLSQGPDSGTYDLTVSRSQVAAPRAALEAVLNNPGISLASFLRLQA